MLIEKYLFGTEKTKKDLYARVSRGLCYGDVALAKRLYEYMLAGWYSPASPILLNIGTNRADGISCFLGEPNSDSLSDIFLSVHEMGVLSKAGGGVGKNLSKIRGAGSPIKGGDLGVSNGITPFAKLYESGILASAQSQSRRGSVALYLDVTHPDIVDFISLVDSKGDMKRKTPDVFTGVIIPDSFMEAVVAGKDYQLIDPNAGPTGKWLSARQILVSIATQRHNVGLPYIFFPDVANRTCLPEGQRKKGLRITTSSLCNEIVSIVTPQRSGTCILSCINLEKWDEFGSKFNQMVEDIVTSLDNVAQIFIDKNSGVPGKEKAVYSTWASREIGLGFAGFHSYIMSKNWAFDSIQARGFDISATNQLRIAAQEASRKLAKERGECTDTEGLGYRQARLLTMMPTASTSQLLNTSKSIEPYLAPGYTLTTDSGNKVIKSRQLEAKIGKDSALWGQIIEDRTLANIAEISVEDKLIHRNAFEINQQSIISMASQRQKAMSANGNMTHTQSINLFYSAGESLKRMIDDIIFAWESEVPSLYYVVPDRKSFKQSECISCQS